MVEADHSDSLLYWLFDTRTIWNDENRLPKAAADALALVDKEEAQKAKTFHFLRDGKLSLGSSLLKRLFAAKIVGVPWAEARFFRRQDPVHGKPCLCLHSAPVSERMEADADFNVAHQAGLVVFVGSSTRKTQVGIDVSCTKERQGLLDKLDTEKKVDEYIDVFGDVFSPLDMCAMKAHIDGPVQAALGEKLRRFYAYWALKEAYIKMVGEGLLAKWLGNVEFRNVKIPRPAPDSHRTGADAEHPSTSWPWGETVTDIEVWINNNESEEDVQVTLQAFEDRYLIATCVSPSSSAVRSPRFEILTLKNDIHRFARKF